MTNGDSAGLLRLYWTLFDANRTAADVLFETTVGAGFGLPASGSVPIAVGGSGRNFPGTLANAEGYVYAPNVNVVEEMVDMISASRAYQNNVEVMNTSKELMLATLRLGQS